MAIAVNGAFTAALFVLLIAQKGWRLGVGALALSAIGVALALAGQAAVASGATRVQHPPTTASYSEHWAWHRVHDFKGPWIWPVVVGLLVLGAALAVVWLASA